MSDIHEIVNRIKEDWQIPRIATHNGVTCPFLLQCELQPAGGAKEGFFERVDNGLRDFWSISNGAVLFKDAQYGQWGLEILTPAQAAAETMQERAKRPSDYLPVDLVIGKFLGDSDLLLLSPSYSSEEQKVLVSLPLYGREDWPVVAHSFAEFLERYVSGQGNKYWE